MQRIVTKKAAKNQKIGNQIPLRRHHHQLDLNDLSKSHILILENPLPLLELDNSIIM